MKYTIDTDELKIIRVDNKFIFHYRFHDTNVFKTNGKLYADMDTAFGIGWSSMKLEKERLEEKVLVRI